MASAVMWLVPALPLMAKSTGRLKGMTPWRFVQNGWRIWLARYHGCTPIQNGAWLLESHWIQTMPRHERFNILTRTRLSPSKVLVAMIPPSG